MKSQNIQLYYLSESAITLKDHIDRSSWQDQIVRASHIEGSRKLNIISGGVSFRLLPLLPDLHDVQIRRSSLVSLGTAHLLLPVNCAGLKC